MTKDNLLLICIMQNLVNLSDIQYFGNSVPEIYTTPEDYKLVIICVHCFQIPIYTAVMSIYVQLQIIFTLLYIEPMPVYFMIQYKTSPQTLLLIS